MEWPVILALVIAIPIVLFVPVLVWGAMVSGVYQVARDAVRRRANLRRRARVAEEPVVRR
ncbi:MAG TPA: hypothetical protein VGA82_01365 [Dehalococcoidales bacterium]